MIYEITGIPHTILQVHMKWDLTIQFSYIWISKSNDKNQSFLHNTKCDLTFKNDGHEVLYSSEGGKIIQQMDQ